MTIIGDVSGGITQTQWRVGAGQAELIALIDALSGALGSQGPDPDEIQRSALRDAREELDTARSLGTMEGDSRRRVRTAAEVIQRVAVEMRGNAAWDAVKLSAKLLLDALR
ncbi:MAG: hypothetical protein GY925_01770 [Actinomycetia bacterium]|nr:hypothetical protein [Actinomycetes bacterium]